MNRDRSVNAPVWKRLYEEDELTIEQIALEYGAHIGTVRKWLHRLGTRMRPVGQRPGRYNDYSAEQLARRIMLYELEMQRIEQRQQLGAA